MHALEAFITTLAHTLPLKMFVLVGSFLEEVIAPIPSPSILVIAGSVGSVQGYSYAALALLVLIASVGKTVGSIVMYHIAGALKDAAYTTVGKRIGLKEADIERFGARFNGTPRDYFVYIFLRSVPVIPSVVLSFGSGVIKLPLRLFMVGTFGGTLVRDSFYILVGYSGTGILHRLAEESASIESLLTPILGGILCIALGYFIYRQRKKWARTE